MVKFRFAAFNVENLFDRPKVFLGEDHSRGDQVLAKIGALQALIDKPIYDDLDKKKMVKIYQKVKNYVEIVESHGKLMDRGRREVKTRGRGDWFGFLRLRRRKFNDSDREEYGKRDKGSGSGHRVSSGGGKPPGAGTVLRGAVEVAAESQESILQAQHAH